MLVYQTGVLVSHFLYLAIVIDAFSRLVALFPYKYLSTNLLTISRGSTCNSLKIGADLFDHKQPVARWQADDLREMVDLQIGVVGINRGGHFNHEIGEMRDIKSHESQH